MLMLKNHRMNSQQSTENATITATTTTTTAPTVVAEPTVTDNTIPSYTPPHLRKKECPLISMTIPGYVTKLEDTKAGGKFLCNPCQSHCNSDIQLSQHLSSRKHVEKLSRKMNTANGGMGELCHLTEVTGRPPNKGNSFCHVCKLSFSSQSVMDTHLGGSKHQRKLKSIEMVKDLEVTEPGFKFDTLTGEVVCTLCNVTFYSPQHINRHVEGEKHKAEKGKRENGDEGGTPAKKLCAASPDQSMGDNEQSSSGFEVSEGNAITTITSTSMSPAPPPKKERPLLNINIPSCVTKLEDSKAGGKFMCNPCQAHCNSDIQLSQHLSSKKHLDKMVLFCDVCYIPFTSEVLLDSHMIGAKHQRRVSTLKSRELLKSLEAAEPCFAFDMNSGEVRCTLCSVTLYSPQHILKHIEGEKHTKHRNRLKDDGEEGNLALKLLLSATIEQTCTEDGQPVVTTTPGASPPNIDTSIPTSTTTAISLSTSLPHPVKKERPLLNITIPAYVSKLEDTKAGGKFLCNPCQAHCNSDIQLSQHLSSKKHSDKLSGRKRSPTGIRGSWRGGRGPMGRGRGGTPPRGGGGLQRMDPLAPTSAFHSSTNMGAYPHTTFTEPNISSYGSDSYGLSSLGRGAVSEYGGFARSGGAGRGSGRGGLLGRNEACGRVEGEYGRAGAAAYTRPDNHSRWSEYGAGRGDELNSYGRPTADYGPRGYASGQGVGHMGGRGMPFTYTQPLSQNFVSGGTIL